MLRIQRLLDFQRQQDRPVVQINTYSARTKKEPAPSSNAALLLLLLLLLCDESPQFQAPQPTTIVPTRNPQKRLMRFDSKTIQTQHRKPPGSKHSSHVGNKKEENINKSVRKDIQRTKPRDTEKIQMETRIPTRRKSRNKTNRGRTPRANLSRLPKRVRTGDTAATTIPTACRAYPPLFAASGNICAISPSRLPWCSTA